MGFSSAPGAIMSMAAFRGSEMVCPICERSLTWISASAFTFLATSFAMIEESTLYIFPTWVMGFLPEVASMDMGRYGVIRPLQRLPRPTDPSSPFSCERPVTVA